MLRTLECFRAYVFKALFLWLVLLSQTSWAVDKDSLFLVAYDESLPSDQRFAAMEELVWQYSYSAPDSAILTGDDMFQLAAGMGERYVAKAYQLKGVAYFYAEHKEGALTNLNHSIDIYEKLNDHEQLAATWNIVGAVHKNYGAVPDAIDAFEVGLDICRESGDSATMAFLYTNIGNAYEANGELVNAMKYYTMALEVDTDIGNDNGVLETLHSMAVVYKGIGDFERALDYYHQARDLYERTGDHYGICIVDYNIAGAKLAMQDTAGAHELFLQNLDFSREHGNIPIEGFSMLELGHLHLGSGEIDSAFSYTTRALELFQNNSNDEGVVSASLALGRTHLEAGDFEDATTHCERAYQLSLDLGLEDKVEGICRCLYESNKGLGEVEKALVYLEKADQQRKQMEGQRSSLEVQRAELQYHFNKQKAIDSLTNAAEMSRRKAQTDYERERAEWNETLAWLWGGGSLLLFVFLIFIGYRYVEKKKSNAIILEQKRNVETQKEELEKRNSEIMESITYAKRLQDAIMPSPKLVKSVYKQSLILYKPKEIVAGDFYWTMHQDNELWIAAADCTGHGVPGAMVSVVCANALNHAFKDLALRDPGEILDSVRETVVETYSSGEDDVKDGMDIALCRLNLKDLTAEYAGANNPIWVLRTNDDPWEDDDELEVLTKTRVEKINGVTLLEVKGDRQPVGMHTSNDPFTTHRLKLMKNDTFYLFSDGYADQFGGDLTKFPSGKKFKYRPFKELLCSVQDEEMDVQLQVLERIFDDWKGSLEQVDDVCVIGVRV